MAFGSSVKGVVGPVLAAVALVGLGGCSSGGVARPNGEQKFCSFIFTVKGLASSGLAVSTGGGEAFSEAGLEAGANHFTTAIRTGDDQAVAHAEGQVEAACERLGIWRG
jgi:hypothetical protein